MVRRTQAREREAARDFAIVGAVGLGLPLVAAATHALDVFDGRNVIAAWIPWALLLAIGLAAPRARRLGASLGICLCVLSLAVIAAINAIPGYQRDDGGAWPGRWEPPRSPDRVLVAERYSSMPLSIYLPGTRTDAGPSASRMNSISSP